MFTFADLFDPSRLRRVLCIGAHADDIEIGCGGTLLALVERVPEVSIDWVVCTAEGERREEAETSAARFAPIGDLRVTVGSFRERYFPYQPDIKEFFEGLSELPNPDLVLVPRHDDAHQDHRTVAELARNTFRNHLMLHYEIVKYDGDLGRPTVYVPLSMEHATAKSDLLFECFPSQRHRPWFDRRTFEGLMRIRGVECHAESGYAEAFHSDRIVLRPDPE